MALKFDQAFLLIGTGNGLLNTTAYSFVASAYADDIEKVIALMEIIVGIGCTLGPVLGSFIYEAVGYAWTFLIFGMAMAPNAILALFLAKPADIKAARARLGPDADDEGEKKAILEIDDVEGEVKIDMKDIEDVEL